MYQANIFDEDLEFDFEPTDVVEAVAGLYVATKLVDNCANYHVRLSKMLTASFSRNGNEVLAVFEILLDGDKVTTFRVYTLDYTRGLTDPVEITQALEKVCASLGEESVHA